jgi:hypothetical protein
VRVCPDDSTSLLLKCFFDMHRTSAGPRGDRVDPMREYGVIRRYCLLEYPT